MQKRSSFSVKNSISRQEEEGAQANSSCYEAFEPKCLGIKLCALQAQRLVSNAAGLPSEQSRVTAPALLL